MEAWRQSVPEGMHVEETHLRVGRVCLLNVILETYSVRLDPGVIIVK